MSESHNNGQLGRLLKDLRDRSYKRRVMRQRVMLVLGAMLLLLLTLLGGCATPAPPPCEPLPPIPLPVVASSPPTTSYSQMVADFFKRSQEMLINASQSVKP